MLAHKVVLITKYDSIKFMMNMPMPMTKITWWMLLLDELGIIVEAPKFIKGKGLTDLLAQFQRDSMTTNPVNPFR